MLKLKNGEELIWGEEQQVAFDQIKQALSNPPILVPLIPGKPLKLYILMAEELISCLLAQDADDGFKKAIFYLSWVLNDAESRYTPIVKLCLSLYYACMKLEYYMLPKEVSVICKIDIVKYLLNKLVLQGKLMR